MSRASQEGGVAFDHSLQIAATPARIIDAFFDPHALGLWWQAIRSVTTPQALGVYAVEWEPTSFRDDLFGPLGGVFYGLVVDYSPGHGFFVADAYWMPPESEPLGPMALQVTAMSDSHTARVHVVQTGAQEGPRWARYHDIITPGWKAALGALRRYLEEGPEALKALHEAQPKPRG